MPSAEAKCTLILPLPVYLLALVTEVSLTARVQAQQNNFWMDVLYLDDIIRGCFNYAVRNE